MEAGQFSIVRNSLFQNQLSTEGHIVFTDLNSVNTPGVYYLSNGMPNLPLGGAFSDMLVIGTPNDTTTQIIFAASKTFVRKHSGTGWTDWRNIELNLV